MRLIYACCLFLALAASAHAEVYVCDDDGHKTYSQQPCGKDAKVVPTQGSSGSITVGDNATPDTLLATCKLMMSGVGIASRLAQENINFNSAQQRVFGYIKDHITNFKEVVHENPAYYTFISQNAVLVTSVGYRTANSGVTDDELNSAIAECTKSALDSWQEMGRVPGQGKPHKTGDKML